MGGCGRCFLIALRFLKTMIDGVLMRRLPRSFIMLCALLAGMPTCVAGPPFLTDDPTPVDFGHNEFYVFGTLDHAGGASAIAGPAIEYNRGILPQTQFHIVVPLAWNVPARGHVTTGIGDVELGIKYRFLDTTDDSLQLGMFPMAEIATGSARRGLGNGRTWYRLPLWVQKSDGAWTFDGGAGVIINPAAGMRNATFGGVLAQYTFSPRWTLGVEVFRQNTLVSDQPAYTLLNTGGYLNFSRDFSLLFSAGASVAGARHAVGYLGLYWTWGAAGSSGTSPPAANFMDPYPHGSRP
jgi:hypothetical protein